MNYGLETWVPVVAMLGVLIWGLRLISKVLLAPQGKTENPLIASALSESNDAGNKTSFSRVSGAIGSIALASFVTGLGLWIFFALNQSDVSIIGRLSNISTYLLGGASLFAPYAFNQLKGLFG